MATGTIAGIGITTAIVATTAATTMVTITTEPFPLGRWREP